MRSAAATLAVVVMLGAGSSPAASPSDAPGAPFVTFAHAAAAGDYRLACEQIAAATLTGIMAPGASTVAAARKACVPALRSAFKKLDEGHRRSFATARVVGVRVEGARASVTVKGALYGVHPRSTGTAILEAGVWKIAKPPSGAHLGSSLVETIPSNSMAPTLHPGDTILANQAAYRHAEPRIGDIVVFHPPVGAVTGHCGKHPPAGQACATATPRSSPVNFVKRIVARPGDRVSIRHGHVIRNGRRAGEGFVAPCGGGGGCDFPRTFTVAAGLYYLLGDNRGMSDDSRFWGPVPAGSIIGRVRRLGP